MRLMLKIGKKSGFYLPSQYPKGYSILDLGASVNFDIDLQAVKFLEDNFKIMWYSKFNCNYSAANKNKVTYVKRLLDR